MFLLVPTASGTLIEATESAIATPVGHERQHHCVPKYYKAASMIVDEAACQDSTLRSEDRSLGAEWRHRGTVPLQRRFPIQEHCYDL